MDREQAHQLLDRLGPSQFNAVAQLGTETLRHSLAEVPVEEEEITRDTAKAIERACASLARGEGVSHEDVLREFGLSK